MKRQRICFLMALLMVFSLLPFTALAGGGGAGWYWPGSYSWADTFKDWETLDGNNDSYTFRRFVDSEGNAYMQSAVQPDGASGAKTADEYLISPQITLADGQEYTLRFESTGDDDASTPKMALYDVYLYAGETKLTQTNVVDALKSEKPAYRTCGSADWSENILDLTSCRGKTIQIVFHQNNTDRGQLELRKLAVYWQEPDEILSKVTATNVPLPQVGKTPANMRESDITFPGFANYELIPGSLTYLRSQNGQVTTMSATERFEDGTEYYIRFRVRPTTATTISGGLSGSASVNGRYATFRNEGDGTVTVDFYFGWLYVGEGNGYISRVDLAVEIPKEGDVFNGSQDDAGAVAVGSDIHYTIKQSKWYNEWGLSAPDMVFEAGSKYFVEIDLTPQSGYRFDKDTIVTINGQPAKVFKEANVSTWYACSENVTIAPKPVSPFTDVSVDAFYFKPVLWAVNHDPTITSGVGNNRFAPNDTCTRSQAVSFLWRAMDCPEPKTTVNPFTDVSASDWYYKPVLWAAENNITSGIGGGKFDPNGTCNRAQIVSFLWRAEGRPEPETADNPFSDVSASDWYYKPVLWAAENGITSGYPDGRFGPNDSCTRGQIVTFLYRDMAKTNKLKTSDFLMYVEDVLTISGRGVVVTGTVLSGTVHTGDALRILGYDAQTNTATERGSAATAIEKNRVVVDSATVGDNVGIILQGVENKSEIQRGDVIVGGKVDVHPVTQLTGTLRLLTKDEGGRHTPIFDNYRPGFYVGTADVTGTVTGLPDGGPLMPGVSAGNVTVTLAHPATVYVGQKLTIREGGRTVGTFTVKEIPG